MIRDWLQRPVASSNIKITLVYILCCYLTAKCVENIFEEGSWWGSFVNNFFLIISVSIQWKEMSWLSDLKKQQ